MYVSQNQPTVAPARPDEIDAVADRWVDLAHEQLEHGSHVEAAANRTTIRAMLAGLLTDEGVLVARDDDEIVGFTTFIVEQGSLELTVDRGVVTNLYVVPSHRRRGIATALLDRAETELENRGVDVILLDVLAPNDGARQFYRERGYTPHRLTMSRDCESPAGRADETE